MDFSVENNGCRLHVRKEGEGPVLLLIHGAGSDASYFADAAECLRADYTVVTYDRCGYSESVFSKEEKSAVDVSRYRVEQQALDVKAVLDALMTQTALVVGISAGGIVALEFAQQYPEYVSELILYEPALAVCEPHISELADWREQLQEAAAQKRISKALLIFVKALGGIDKGAPQKSLQQQYQNLMNLKVFLQYELQDFLTYSDRLKEDFCLDMPCVLGSGRLDTDGIISKAAETNAKKIGARLSMVDGYHNFAEERPREFAEWIYRVIRELRTEQFENLYPFRCNSKNY